MVSADDLSEIFRRTNQYRNARPPWVRSASRCCMDLPQLSQTCCLGGSMARSQLRRERESVSQPPTPKDWALPVIEWPSRSAWLTENSNIATNLFETFKAGGALRLLGRRACASSSG